MILWGGGGLLALTVPHFRRREFQGAVCVAYVKKLAQSFGLRSSFAQLVTNEIIVVLPQFLG